MAITSEITVSVNSTNLPSNYTPTPPSNVFVDPVILNIVRDEPIAAIPNADGAVGVGNLTTAILAWLDTTYYPTILKLDAAQTIIATATVVDIQRTNDTLVAKRDHFFPGAEVYRTRIKIEWE